MSSIVLKRVKACIITLMIGLLITNFIMYLEYGLNNAHFLGNCVILALTIVFVYFTKKI